MGVSTKAIGVALALACSVTALWGCRADDVVKQGVEGEFCNNRDSDCRDGHICEDGICRALESTAGVTCGEMCQRLEECATGEEDCEADCRATLAGTCEATPCPWTSDAIEAFGTCIIEELTCEEAREADAPNTCYRRIPIPDERANRCDAFVAAATSCSPQVVTTELRNRCYLLGRTNGPESWARTDGCVSRVSDGLCTEIGDCFNAVFELESRLDLGTGSIGSGGGDDIDVVPVGEATAG